MVLSKSTGPSQLGRSDESGSRVLLLIGHLEGGGAERQCFLLARGLHAAGLDVLVATKNASDRMVVEYERAGVPVHVLAMRLPRGWNIPKVRSPILKALFLRELAALYRRFDPIVVQAYLPSSNCAAVLARWLCPVPIVFASHRYAGSATIHYDIFQGLETIFCRSADVNLANSDGVASHLRRVLRLPRRTIRTVYNGVEPIASKDCLRDRDFVRAELGLLPEEIALVKVANLWPYKGHEDLLRALKLCVAEDPRLRTFFIGGDRGHARALESIARELGLASRVTFLGERSDVCRLLPAFDIYVSASHAEGMSNAIMEAMQHRLAIIGSRVAGTPELLDQGRAGMLFEAHDGAGLARSILSLAGDPARRAELGARAALRVETEFQVDRMVARTLALYSEVAAQQGLASAVTFADASAELLSRERDRIQTAPQPRPDRCAL